MQKHLILGAGEVGTSLKKVLERTFPTFIRDRDEEVEVDGRYGIVLHVCYPYSESFVEDTKAYVEKYRPDFTVVHSTVPPGTTRKLGNGYVHSPIHGKHPNLAEGILTYAKYVGGVDHELTRQVVKMFRDCGINAVKVPDPETSELSKIFCTTDLAIDVIYMHVMKAVCDKYGADFKMAYGWREFYNHGMKKLGKEHMCRPVLEYIPGPLGGHCCDRNSYLLDSVFTNLVRDYVENPENYE